jgi:hypothetical protein
MVIWKELKGDGNAVLETTTSKCVSLHLRMNGRIMVSMTETTGEFRGNLSYR